MEAKFIGLALSNPDWNKLCSLVTRRYEDWIELSKCGLFEGNFYEPDQHITLYYNEDCPKGPNYLYWASTCYCKSQYEAIKGYESILLLNPYIDTFNNDDSRVLKVNVLASDCNAMNIITSWHDRLQEKLPKDNYPTYHPHITITYLKPDTPDTVVNKMIEELQTEKLGFKPTEILIGGGEDVDYKSFRFNLI